jgi:hypothetical protein
VARFRDGAAGSGDDIEPTRKVTAPANPSVSSPSKPLFEIRIGEATGGFEPPIAVLQTAALPLGYVAWRGRAILPNANRCGCDAGYALCV